MREKRKTAQRRESLKRRPAHNAPRRWRHGDSLFKELVALACEFLTEGHPPKDIQRLMEEKLKSLGREVKLKREDPYRFIAYAATQGQLRFVPPLEYELAERVKKAYPQLETVKVVVAPSMEGVAYHGAVLLQDLMRAHRVKVTDAEVHLGFGGGYASRKLAKALADLLQQADDVPQTVFFHALAGGFDLEEDRKADSTNPSSFWGYFVDNPGLRFKTKFVGLSAPGLVTPEDFETLKKLRGIAEVFTDQRSKVDIIVTAAAHWGEKHSQYMRVQGAAPEFLKTLEEAGCVGDFMWHPIVRRPELLEGKVPIRPMTLFDLDEISDRVESGRTRLLLVIGPCGACDEPKTKILEAVLERKRQLVTDLVVDHRCASELVRDRRASSSSR